MARGFSLKKTNFSISDEVKQGISDFENRITEDRKSEIIRLPLSRIKPNPKNNYSMTEIETLADLIADHGQLQPALVVPDGDKYRLVAGERRYQALRKLGRDTMDAIVLDNLSTVDEEILLISANAYRTKTDVEKAWELTRLTDLYRTKEKEMPGFLQGRSVAQAVAEQAGTSVITVNRAQRLDRLIPELKSLVEEGALGASAAILFADLHPDNQQEVVEVIRSRAADNEKLSREEAKVLQSQYKEYKKQAEAEKKKANDRIKSLRQQMKEMDSAIKGGGEAEQLRREKQALQEQLRQLRQQKVALGAGPVDTGDISQERVRLQYSLTAIGDTLDTLEKHVDQVEALRELLEPETEEYREALERLQKLEKRLELSTKQ